LKLFSHHQKNWSTQRGSSPPKSHGLALAFQNPKPGQSSHEAIFMARLGLAYLGLAGWAKHSTEGEKIGEVGETHTNHVSPVKSKIFCSNRQLERVERVGFAE
jgi:hypothetical protein